MHVLNYDETYIFSTQHILFCVISAFVGQASGKKGSSSLGTGKQTLRISSKGQAKVEEVRLPWIRTGSFRLIIAWQFLC